MTTTYGTLSIPVPFGAQVEYHRRGASTPASGGFVAARQLRSSVSRQGNLARTRTWDVTFRDVDSTERDAVLNAEAAALGGALPILWTPPPPDDAAAIPVRFLSDEDGASTIYVEHGSCAQLFDVRCQLEEVA